MREKITFFCFVSVPLALAMAIAVTAETITSERLDRIEYSLPVSMMSRKAVAFFNITSFTNVYTSQEPWGPVNIAYITRYDLCAREGAKATKIDTWFKTNWVSIPGLPRELTNNIRNWSPP